MINISICYMLYYLMYIKSRLHIYAPLKFNQYTPRIRATSFTSPPQLQPVHWGGKQLEIKQLGMWFYQFLGDIYIHWCVYTMYILYIFLWICSFINISRPWGHVFLNSLGVLLLKQICTCLPLVGFKVGFSWSLIVMAFSRNCSWRQMTLTV